MNGGTKVLAIGDSGKTAGTLGNRIVLNFLGRQVWFPCLYLLVTAGRPWMIGVAVLLRNPFAEGKAWIADAGIAVRTSEAMDQALCWICAPILSTKPAVQE